MKNKLLIIGASGHGKVVADIALKMNKWKEIAFLDDNESIKECLGLKVIDTVNNLKHYIKKYAIFIAIGDNTIRKMLFEKVEKYNGVIPTLIHPSAVIGHEVEIGLGSVIMANTVINSSTEIGRGCIINTAATVDHDNKIDQFVHIAPGVRLAGNVEIGESTFIGIGSTIKNNIKITEKCLIGAGALVISDIDKEGIYKGLPAKISK